MVGFDFFEGTELACCSDGCVVCDVCSVRQDTAQSPLLSCDSDCLTRFSEVVDFKPDGLTSFESEIFSPVFACDRGGGDVYV